MWLYLKAEQGTWLAVSKQKVDFDKDFLFPYLRKPRKSVSFYRQAENITAYRLFNQEGDGFAGLTVDQYGDYALFFGTILLSFL